MNEILILLLIFIVLPCIIGFLLTCVKVVPFSKAWVLEHLGGRTHVWNPGLHVKAPIIDRIVKKISLKEQMIDYKPQPAITQDNITLQIDSVVFYQISTVDWDAEQEKINKRFKKKIDEEIDKLRKEAEKARKDAERARKEAEKAGEDPGAVKDESVNLKERIRATEDEIDRQRMAELLELVRRAPSFEEALGSEAAATGKVGAVVSAVRRRMKRDIIEEEKGTPPPAIRKILETNVRKFAYAADKPMVGVENLLASIIRDYVAGVDFSQVQKSRELLNMKAIVDLNAHTIKQWGVMINRVEIKSITPPKKILEDAEKVKAAANEKQAKILEAQGQAEAIKMVQSANAEAIKMMKEAGADQSVLALKSFEAMEKMAQGKATKIIIPSELQNMAGTISAITELAGKRENAVLEEKDDVMIPLPEKMMVKDLLGKGKRTASAKDGDKKAEEKDKKTEEEKPDEKKPGDKE